MPTHRAPWTEAVYDRLARGPATVEELSAEFSGLVPPGRAYRRAIGMVEHHRTRSGSGERHYVDTERVKDMRIKNGQRWTVLSAIRGLVRTGRLEECEVDGQRGVRLAPHVVQELRGERRKRNRAPVRLPRPERRGPVLVFLLNSVTDEWQPYEPLVQTAMRLIPRDDAIKRAVSNRQRLKAHANQESPDRKRVGSRARSRDLDYTFLVGARIKVSGIFRNARQAQYVETEVINGEKVVRRGPRWAAAWTSVGSTDD